MKSTYTKYKEQDLSIDEIKIKLTDNSPFLSNILILLGLLVTLFSLLYNSAIVTSNNRYNNRYNINNQKIEIALKSLEFDKKDKQLAGISKLSTQVDQVDNQIRSQLEKTNNENQQTLNFFISLVIVTIFILLLYTASQVYYRRTLYKLLHEKEQLLNNQKVNIYEPPMFYVE